MIPFARRLSRCDRGASALEFALVMPIFLLLVCGVLVYGCWFALAHTVQGLANEGARASIGGLDEDERRTLAQGYIDAQAGPSGLSVAHLTREVETTGGSTRVTVRFDVSGSPIMALSQIVPAPPAVIERSAVVLAAG